MSDIGYVMGDIGSEKNRLIDNNIIIGREKDVYEIQRQFNNLLLDISGLNIISGEAGVGKTSLICHAINELGYKNITYVYSKFNNSKGKPFGGVVSILDEISRYMLVLPEEELKKVKKLIVDNLGTDINLLANLSSYFTKLVGNVKDIQIDSYDRLKYRIKKAIYNFMIIGSRTLFPLIICFDDIQWADGFSIDVIKKLSLDIEEVNIHLILSMRCDKNGRLSRRLNWISKLRDDSELGFIELKELTYNDIDSYLRQILSNSILNKEYISRLVYSLSLGNAFQLNQIINILLNNSILRLGENDQWKLDMDKLGAMSLPHNIEQSIDEKLRDIKPMDRELIEIIACLDGSADIDLLKSLASIDIEHTLERLSHLNIIYLDDKSKYTFIHDLIYELIYKRIKEKDRQALHLKIAKELVDCEYDYGRLFIANQILRCDANNLLEILSFTILQLMYEAGLEAKISFNIDLAQDIFSLTNNLIDHVKYGDMKELALDISIELGECEFLEERLEDAKVRYDYLIKIYEDIESQIKIKRRYMKLYMYVGDSLEVVVLGKQVLKHLNYNLIEKHLKLDLLIGRLLFTNRNIKGLEYRNQITEDRILTILEVLTQMIPAANIVDDRLFLHVLGKIGLLSIRYGNSSYASIGYISYSMILQVIWHDYKKGEVLKEVAISLLNDGSHYSSTPMLNSLTGTFVEHGLNGIESSIKYLEISIEEGINIGEFIFSGYSIISLVYAKYIQGIPLRKIYDYTCDQLSRLPLLSDDITTFADEILLAHIIYLECGKIPRYDEIMSQNNLLEKNKVFSYSLFKLQRLYLAFRYKEAYELSGYIEKNLKLLKGHLIYIDLIFYLSLVKLEVFNDAHNSEKRQIKRCVKRYLKILTKHVKRNDNNHYARYLILSQRYDDIIAKKSDKSLYNQAIHSAINEGQIQLVALANMMLAKSMKHNESLREFHFTEAINNYREWGAPYIADIIATKYSIHEIEKDEEMLRIKNIRQTVDRDIIDELNILSNMQETQAFKYALEYISKMNNLDFGAILFEKAENMYIHYKYQNKNVNYYEEPIPIKYTNQLSHKIIRYVARTGDDVIFNSKPREGIFSKDIYLIDKSDISIICLAISYLGVFIGTIYIEKNCDYGFSKKDIAMVKGLLPSLVSKKSVVQDININSIINTRKEKIILTEREVELLRLVSEGLSNASISKELYITIGTVKNHLSNIYTKLGVDSRIKAVIRAKELNII